VFKLGRTFKSLHKTITLSADGILPVLPEDLIYRFAEKLEFGEFRDKVAEDAIRMVQRMSMDWMVQGRRPSGVCGACLILAARMNNFRRTITEVVYIVKVTTHTIQKRLDEFKVTPSSALTVEEFLNNEFLETAHDPPSFYEKSEEWQKNKKKRKRRGHDGFDEEDENGENSGSNGEGEGGRSKRQKTTEPNPNPDQPVQSVELRRDADGFAIPPQPTQSHDIPIDPDLVDEAIADQTSTTFDKLVAQFGDIPDAPSNPDEDGDASSTTSAPKLRETRLVRAINVPDEWAAMEERMETEISEVINDPNTIYHAASYAKAQRRAAAHMLIAEKDNPSRNISMDVHIGEDEFADDPEVVNCILAEEEVRKKEKVWVNTNRDWLRKQQIKMWRQKQAENGPPKAKRNRKRKPRIGEGQTTAASSPAEAAINVMKERAFSKKINYNAIADIFKGISNLKNGDELGSAGTSRVTSQAGSDIGDSTEGSSRASSLAPSVAESVNSQASTGSNFLRVPKDHYVRRKKAAAASTTGTPRATSASPSAARVQSPAVTDEGDDDDYVRPSPTPRARAQEPEDETEDWRSQVRNANQVGTGLDEEEEVLDDEEDYDDYGGVEAGGIPDDVSDRGFDLDDDEDIGFGDDD
jgi:transcription factor IIIB subunit 2